METCCLIKKEMLPEANRLKKRTEIEKVFKKGKTLKEDFLILLTLKNNLDKSRFALIVPKTVSKKAALRNRIKRRLREIIRPKLKIIKEGIDAIILVRPGIENKDFWEIAETINQLFQKAKILKKLL